MSEEDFGSRFEVGGDALLTVARAALEARGYHLIELPGNVLSLTIGCQRGAYGVFMLADDATHYLRVQASYGSFVPADRRPAVAECIARINYDLPLGALQIDFADGEVQYRHAIDVDEGTLSTAMVDNVMGYALRTLDRYHAAVMQVAFGDLEPAAALTGLE